MSESQEDKDIISADNMSDQLFVVKLMHSCETMLSKNPFKEDITRKHVIINSRYGKDMGIVLGPIKDLKNRLDDEIYEIERIATDVDLTHYEELKVKEAEALTVCREKIELHNLDMKLVSAHYLTDDSKVLFFFTAENRVDFRDLVKDLVSVFRMRIELRQIGVRDESRVLGGLAVCGRNYCCNGLSDKLNPVSIKMAKDQNLSLNSMKISGPCGRLLCCLSYEYLYYREEREKFPSVGLMLDYKDKRFRVSEVNYITHKVMLCGSEQQNIQLPLDCFKKDESGKWRIASFPQELIS